MQIINYKCQNLISVKSKLKHKMAISNRNMKFRSAQSSFCQTCSKNAHPYSPLHIIYAHLCIFLAPLCIVNALHIHTQQTNIFNRISKLPQCWKLESTRFAHHTVVSLLCQFSCLKFLIYMLLTDDDARDDDARYVARTMYTQMWNPTKINFRFDSLFLVQPNWAASKARNISFK